LFTGLIETIGTISTVKRLNKNLELGVIPDRKDFSVSPGSSVAINGICLTVITIEERKLYFNAVHETLEKTTLARAGAGERVNMERALRLGDRLDGHVVQGHIDCMGTIAGDDKIGNSILRKIAVPAPMMKFMAYKGSIAIEGISLTIAFSDNGTIGVSLIPYTLEKTTMGGKKTGDRVNIECDVFARYIHQLIRLEQPQNSDENHESAYNRSEGLDLLTVMENAGF
jgi:riboflavin synthase